MSIQTGTLAAYLSITETTNPTAIESIIRSLQAGTATGITFNDGSGDYALTKAWGTRESLAGTTKTWDLTALPLPNVATLGTGSPVVSISKVKLLIVQTEATDGQRLLFGAAGSNAWTAYQSSTTNKINVEPSSPLVLTHVLAQTTNPWTVDATHKNLLLDNTSFGTFFYNLLIAGV